MHCKKIYQFLGENPFQHTGKVPADECWWLLQLLTQLCVSAFAEVTSPAGGWAGKEDISVSQPVPHEQPGVRGREGESQCHSRARLQQQKCRHAIPSASSLKGTWSPAGRKLKIVGDWDIKALQFMWVCSFIRRLHFGLDGVIFSE